MAPYRLIVVDDEETTRTGLADFIGWQELGFTLIGTFSDGRAALAWLENNEVDVVLSDIRMPCVSGLELAEHIRRFRPSIQVVLISGYKEFDYARRAIEFGVKHYLLKPTRLPEVRATFGRLYAELEAEHAENSTAQHRSERYREALPYLRDQFFRDLISGNLTHDSDLRRRAVLIDLALDPLSSPCALATVEVVPDPFDDYGDSRARAGGLTRAVAAHLDTSRCFIISPSSCRYTLLVTGPPDTEPRSIVREAESALSTVEHALTAFGDGVATASPVELFRSLLDLALQRGGSAQVEIDRAAAAQYTSVVHEIQTGDPERGLRMLAELVRTLDGSGGPASVRWVVGALAAADARILELRGGTVQADSVLIPYSDLVSVANNRQLSARVLPILDQLTRLLESGSTVASRETTRAAIDYIDRHFGEDLTLQELSDRLRLNPTYLSRLFHREVGVTFTEYLTDRRMKRAAELLGGKRHRVQDVSRECGYGDAKYFARVFRRRFGVSPTDYARRRQYGGEP